MKNIPQDLCAALKENGLDSFFSNCTAAHRNEYLKWIAEAKCPETRQQRIGNAIKMISTKSIQKPHAQKERSVQINLHAGYQ